MQARAGEPVEYGLTLGDHHQPMNELIGNPVRQLRENLLVGVFQRHSEFRYNVKSKIVHPFLDGLPIAVRI